MLGLAVLLFRVVTAELRNTGSTGSSGQFALLQLVTGCGIGSLQIVMTL